MCRFLIVEMTCPPLVVAEQEAEGAAKAAAEDMAGSKPGTAYSVYQLVGSAVVEPKVVWSGAKA